jgi:hypothetical protein
MAKLSNKSATGTSFHDVVIKTTAKALIDALGPAQWGNNDGSDKTNFDWICETNAGKVFTIYDWKFYRPLDLNEPVMFHIGANSRSVSEIARLELINLLAKKV